MQITTRHTLSRIQSLRSLNRRSRRQLQLQLLLLWLMLMLWMKNERIATIKRKRNPRYLQLVLKLLQILQIVRILMLLLRIMLIWLQILLLNLQMIVLQQQHLHGFRLSLSSSSRKASPVVVTLSLFFMLTLRSY